MGCTSCKKKQQVINNLDNPDHINMAKEIYNDVILGGDITTYTDLDKMEIYRAYETLYPNSSVKPSLEDAIEKIKIGIEIYGKKYNRG